MARVTVGVAHDSLTIGQNLLLFIGNCLHIIEIFSCKTKQPKQTNKQTNKQEQTSVKNINLFIRLL